MREENENSGRRKEGGVTEPFALVGGLELLDQGSRSAEAILGRKRTLRRRIFTKGRTESDFLYYSLGELSGH